MDTDHLALLRAAVHHDRRDIQWQAEKEGVRRRVAGAEHLFQDLSLYAGLSAPSSVRPGWHYPVPASDSVSFAAGSAGAMRLDSCLEPIARRQTAVLPLAQAPHVVWHHSPSKERSAVLFLHTCLSQARLCRD